MATTLTYTAGDIANAALRKGGVVATDRDATAAEMSQTLVTFNAMLKAWQIPGVTMWKLSTGSITLTDATQSYTVSGRPLELGVVNWRDANGRDLPMVRLTREEYYELPIKDAAGPPTQYYYHRQRETATLFVWPVQTTAEGTIEFEGKFEIDDITATTDTLDVPAEHYESIIYGLSDRCCDDFGVIDRHPAIKAMAMEARDLANGFDRETVYFQPDFEGGY